MKIIDINYIGSYPAYSACPKDDMPEYAFIGRSNVGKSSLINFLADRKNIARTSKSPGKTQSLNFYKVDNRWHLVDLPGYGYAKVSKKERHRWKLMIKNYLIHRHQMQNAFLLIDINVTPQEIDLAMINWLGENGVPFGIVFTKSDKKHKDRNDLAISDYENRLTETWELFPPYYLTSSIDKYGQKDIFDLIKEVNANYIYK